MKSDVFYWVLNMSIHGGLLCLIVLLLRRIRAFPKGFVYGLWCLPFLRLICPLGVKSPWSFMNLLERLGTREVEVSELALFASSANGQELASTDVQIFATFNHVQFANSYAPITYKTNVLTGTMETLTLIWFIVACACLLTALLLYIFTKRELRGAEKREGFYCSDRVTAPALYGILRPRIVLPYGVSEEARPHILRHEGIHRKRGDNLWRAVGILTCCVHWFNPLCWLCLKYFFEDMELSCDAAAIGKMDEQGRKDYALALLESAEQKNLFVSAFGGAKLRLRIKNILAYRNLTLMASLAFAALFAVIALVLATN